MSFVDRVFDKVARAMIREFPDDPIPVYVGGCVNGTEPWRSISECGTVTDQELAHCHGFDAWHGWICFHSPYARIHPEMFWHEVAHRIINKRTLSTHGRLFRTVHGLLMKGELG